MEVAIGGGEESAREGGRLDPIMMTATTGSIGRRIGRVTIVRMARSYLPVRRDVANAIVGVVVSVSLLLGNVPSATAAILVTRGGVQDAWLGGEPPKLAMQLLKQSYLLQSLYLL